MAPARHNISEVSSQSRQMPAFVMKAGQDHCASTTPVRLWGRLALDTGRALVQSVMLPSVIAMMASLVITVSKVVTVFASESSPTVVAKTLKVLCDMAATRMEDATIFGRATSIPSMVFALISRRKNKSVCVETILNAR